jgi:hypothetical protein
MQALALNEQRPKPTQAGYAIVRLPQKAIPVGENEVPKPELGEI